jgi:serine phosphatase RsbU (regulator of sigma subunit)
MQESHLHDGYVLRVMHNDQKLQNLKRSEFYGFILNLLIFTLPIFILILWRARKISISIQGLVGKIDLIQSQRALHERVEITGNNEVTELGEHFNKMVEELQESYSGLEQKVAERTQEVVAQKEIIEEVYHEIKDSINYAKRLQQAILPKFSDIKAALNQYFVLFKPKDVVSGDFYWFEQKGNKLFIAAADCTGHGVPGALVSVVCSNALNRSVNEFGLTSPAQILNKTRELVIETFAKSGENVKDGMDIAICVIEKHSALLTYTGANNPLWLVRDNSMLREEEMNAKTTTLGEKKSLIEFKPDKQPVGLYAEMKDFSEIQIKTIPGDTFYFFTDGYADQFGGENGKKC